MNRPLGELASLVKGQLSGDPDTIVTGAATIACSTSNDLTFANTQKHVEAFFASEAIAAIVSASVDLTALPADKNVIVVDDSEASFTQIVAEFRPPIQRPKIGISPQAIVSDSA